MLKVNKPIKNVPQVTSLEASITKPLKVLITRPKGKAQQLASLLNEQGIANTSQALFDYQNSTCTQNVTAALKDADIIIFVSIAAVEFTHASYPLKTQLPQTIVAVGNATKHALVELGAKNIISPPLQQENSEGLLNLPELMQVKDKNIVIFRGNGGREHLANTLKQRGAKVHYQEVYQRVWHKLTKNYAEQWRALQINCIVVTSNDILLALTNYLNITKQTPDIKGNYWQSQCLWLVVSERIEKNAKALGIKRIINTGGASSNILCNTLQTLACS